MSGRRWEADELALLRDNYGEVSLKEFAETFGRSVGAVGQRAVIEGLAKHVPRIDARDHAQIRKLVAKGWCNRCIGRKLNHARCHIRKWRVKLGLPAITARGMTDCPVCKERTRATTKEQCRKAGVKNMAEIRRLAFDKFARDNGWPEDLRPREVQILNVLAAKGVPMTRLELAAAIGMRTDRMGANGTLALLAGCNGPGGTYTASLMRRGLLLALKHGATVHGHGKGRSRDLYFLGPAALAILEERACQQQTADSI